MKLLLSFLIVTTTLLLANTLHLDDPQKRSELIPYLYIYEDTDENLTLEAVEEKKFSSFDAKKVSFSKPNTKFWFFFDVVNTTDNNQWFFESEERYPAWINIYTKSKYATNTYKSGEKVPFSQRSFKTADPIFLLTLPKGETTRVFIELKALDFKAHFHLEPIESHVIDTQRIELLKGIFLGIIFALIVYNIILAINLKSLLYAYYSSYMTFMLLFVEADNGVLFTYIHPEWVSNNGIDKFAFVAVGTFFLMLFSGKFLQVDKFYPKVFKAMLFYALINGAFAINHIIMQHISSFTLFNNSLLIAPIFIFTISVLTWKRGYEPVRIYALGYGVFMLFAMLTVLNNMHVIEWDAMTTWGLSLGLSFEAILFSFALYKRLRFDEKERMRYEIQARKKDKMLLLQSRMAGMGEMLGDITHQWKQPLSSIAISVANLELGHKMGSLDDKSIDETIENVQEQIALMEQTSRDFLNYYKPDKEAKIFDISQTVHLAIKFTKAVLIKHNISFSIKESSKSIEIFGYKNELNQALINIINNAKDALIDNHIQDPKIIITLMQDESHSIIEIEDNAGGIPEAIIAKIFNPYFTTKEKKNGTGIGLGLSKQIIEESMDGTLKVRNGKEGAIFTIIFHKI